MSFDWNTDAAVRALRRQGLSRSRAEAVVGTWRDKARRGEQRAQEMLAPWAITTAPDEIGRAIEEGMTKSEITGAIEQGMVRGGAKAPVGAIVPNQPMQAETLAGSFDAFPAQVKAVKYATAMPAKDACRKQFVVLERVSVLRDTTNHYPVSGPASVQGVEPVAFVAQPLLGLDCPLYYVEVGRVVMAFINRDPSGQNFFIRDEDPFIGQVTAVDGNTVTVNRKVWASDPDGGGFAGPTFGTNVKTAAGADVTYASVRFEADIASQGEQPWVGQWVMVWRRGRYLVCRPLTNQPRLYFAMPIDGKTLPTPLATATGGWDDTTLPVANRLVGFPLIDILNDKWQSMIPGPSRLADGTYVPCLAYPCQMTGIWLPATAAAGGDRSPWDLAQYLAAGTGYGITPIMVYQMPVGTEAGFGDFGTTFPAGAKWFNPVTPPLPIRAIITTYPVGADWTKFTVNMGYASASFYTAWATGQHYTVGLKRSDPVLTIVTTVWTCAVEHDSGAGTFLADRVAHPTWWTPTYPIDAVAAHAGPAGSDAIYPTPLTSTIEQVRVLWTDTWREWPFHRVPGTAGTAGTNVIIDGTTKRLAIPALSAYSGSFTTADVPPKTVTIVNGVVTTVV